MPVPTTPTPETAPIDEAATPPVSLLARGKALGANSLAYLIGYGLIQGLSVLLAPLYTRHLDTAAYGILGVTTTVTLLLTILFGFALNGAISRLYFETEDEAVRGQLYLTVLVFVAAAGAVGVGVLEVVGRTGAFDGLGVAYEPYLRFAVAAAYLTAFLEIPVAIATVREQPSRVLALTVGNAVLIAAITIALVVLLDQGVLGALRALVAAAGITAAVAICVVLRQSALPLSARVLRTALAFSVPLIPHLVAHWALYLSDRIVLAQYVSTADLGLYSLGASVGVAGALVATSFQRAFTPAITRLLKEDGANPQVPRLATYWYAALAWACCALALIADDLILIAIPPEFEGATRVAAWIVFGYLAFGIYTIVSQGTWFAMRTRWVPVLTVIAGLLNVVGNVALIPVYGFEAAGWTTLGAFVLLAIMQGALSHRLHPIRWELFRWLQLTVAAAVTFGVGSVLPGQGTATGLAAQGGVALLVFPLVLTLLLFWSPAERATIRSLVAG